MLVSSRPFRLLLIGLAACAVTWAFASVAAAKPVDVQPVDPSAWTAAASPVTAGVGDHSVPDPRQVDAVLADLRRDDAAEQSGAPSPAGSDTETVALVLSIVAILTALGAVTLTVTRSRGRILGT
jgi:hypothetical protein